MSHYVPSSKLPQGYDEEYGEDDDLDDDYVDGYDCLSDDYDDELDYVESSEKRDSRSYGRSHHDGPSGSSRSNRSADLRRHRSISEGCPRAVEHPDDNRRDHHNHLERKRRASIKGSYTELRETIPALRGSKASRALTLQRAVEYIEELSKRNHEHKLCVDTLTRQNEALDRQVQDYHRNYARLEEDEYAAVAALDRSNLPPTSGSPTSFNQTCISVPQPPPPPVNHQVRFISPPASVATTVVNTPTHPVATTTPAGQSSDVLSSGSAGGGGGYPMLRVIQQESTPPSDQMPAVIPTSGLAQLSYAAHQLQQQRQQSSNPTPTPSVSTGVRTVTVESTPLSTRVPAIIPHQRVRLSNSCSVVKTIKCTNVTYPNVTSSSASGTPVVVVATAAALPTNHRLITTPATFSSTVSCESSGDAASLPSSSCFSLDTAVLKARNQVAPVMKENQDAVPISQPHHPRRVVIVSAQGPPNSKS